MIMLVIVLAVYIFCSLCLFLIAKKLNVSAPWTAWVPLVNLWTVVTAAGKPWWWILLMFIPIIGPFIGVYLWMCITENLGKNKWLGLLLLVPIAGFVWMGILAFSKSESTGGLQSVTLHPRIHHQSKNKQNKRIRRPFERLIQIRTSFIKSSFIL